MKKSFDIYIKKLTSQELGYRRGRLMTGGYFYISKYAVGSFFVELDRYKLNDNISIELNDQLEKGEYIKASYVYHNDKFSIQNGTRNEYRIYHNRGVSTHELHFQPADIVVFFKEDYSKYRLELYTKVDKEYNNLLKILNQSKINGNHALLTTNDYNAFI
jgi:hypothetical protein